MVLADSRRTTSRAGSAPASGGSRSGSPAGLRPGPIARRAPRRPPGELAGTALLALGLLTAYASLHVLLRGLSWYLAGAVFMLLVLAAAAITRRVQRRSWLAPIVAAAVALLGLTVGYAADKALLGVVPTPEVFGRFSRLADSAWLSIAEQSLPATPELGIVFLLVLLCIGCALFGDAVLRRAPALTAVPLLTLLAVPVAVRAGVADWLWYVATAIVLLVLLRRGQWRASVPAVLVSGAVVVAGSLVVPLVLPGVPQVEQTGSGIDSAVNPLINLGDDLRRGSSVTAVTYTTSTDQAMYLRLATLDRFDGRQWAPGSTTPPDRNSVDRFPAPVGLTSAVERSKVTAAVKVGDITGRWLPVPYPSSSITGVDGDWRWVAGGLSVRSDDTSAGGQDYGVSFLNVQPDLQQLRAATISNVTASVGDLDLPDGMPAIIGDTARKVTASADTEYDKALALQNYFQTSGGFTYSETAPVEQGYDGTGAQIIAKFLEKKAGYCVHFASSMAVMARTLGIPARVVVGFQPGSPSTQDGATVFTVSSHDLHAWPELYFAGIGWLRFEPTPGRGELPVYSIPAAVDDSISQGPTGEGATPGATSSAEAPTAGPTDPAEAASGAHDDATTGSTGGVDATGALIAGGVLLVVILLLLTPAAVRVVIRRRRLRDIVRGRDPAAAAWAEVRDTARDHGWAAPESETPRDFADRLAVVLSAHGPVIQELRGSVENVAFARTPTPISLEELRRVRRAIADSVPPRDRARAILLPPTLVARVRGDGSDPAA